MCRHIFIFIIIILPSLSIAQVRKQCFQLKISDDNVFTKVLQPPYYSGGRLTFESYLKYYSFSPFVADELLKSDSLYFDTARVQFVISRYGVMSDLFVSKGKSAEFKKEIYRMMKESSCSWNPGNADGRNVNVWVQIDFFFMLKRNANGSRQHNFIVKYYDYKSDD